MSAKRMCLRSNAAGCSGTGVPPVVFVFKSELPQLDRQDACPTTDRFFVTNAKKLSSLTPITQIKHMKKLTALLTLAGMAIGCSALAADIDWSKLPPAATTENVTFEKDIAPILKATCVRCHGAERPKAGLRLDTLEGI